MPYTRTTTKTRRQFLKQSAVATGMFTLFGGCSNQPGAGKLPVDQKAIGRFQKKFSGNIIVPTDAAYESLRKTRMPNPGPDKYPAIIAQCKNEEDVLRCIDFAHEQHFEVAVRSGNHSLLGWGSCDKGLVIDLSTIKQIDVDPERRTVRTMPGNTAEEILAATAAHGLAPVMGQCGTVGAGLVLGGGLGFLSGKYGATCDTLLGASLVTADGKRLQANSTTNTDLFWAIRGGGGNFGVATAFEYQLYPENAILGGQMTYPIEKAPHIIRWFRDFMSTAPDELQGDFYYSKQGSGKIAVELVYSGDLNKGEELMNTFRRFEKPTQDWIKRRTFSEIYNMGEDAAPSETPPPCAFSSVKGAYLEKLSDEAIDFMLDRVNNAPRSCHVYFNLSHYMHGQVCRVAPDATAYELRKADAVNTAYMIGWNEPKDAAAALSWHHDFSVKLDAFSGGRIYSNFMSAEGGDFGKAVYGKNYERLLQLKRKYDPGNFFHLNHNIQPK